ncbi:MAG: hypothetical protein F6K45_09555 [Kamptonema sp. SIO1D9]|nr:hypothetical protein [Kamptonema sp. SIO1D9]
MRRKILTRLAGATTTIALTLGMTNIVEATQLVYLDFESRTDPGEYTYSATEQQTILKNVAADYSLFDIEFTLEKPTSGDFSTVFYNTGILGALADPIDFRNLDKNDNVIININFFLNPDLFPEIDPVALSSFLTAHELGHILGGLRHRDSFGPIGSGIYNPPGADAYFPTYPGPVAADETLAHLQVIPEFGIGINQANEDLFLSERSAVRLSFSERGKLVSEEAGNNSFATAQELELAQLEVPNPLLTGKNAGKEFLVEAIAVTGSLDTPEETDFFSFSGKKGELFNIEVLSTVLQSLIDVPLDPEDPIIKEEGRITDPIDPILSIFDSNGDLVPYYDSVAVNNDEYELLDSVIIDLILPKDDTYFIQVSSDPTCCIDLATGDYELFAYNFEAVESKTVPEPNSAIALTAIGISLFATAKSRRKSKKSNS